MKKIGFLVLALIFAFGALGVGYAGWIDSVWVNGTVNTGDVDIEIIEVSNTYAYKDLDDDSLYVNNWRIPEGQWGKILVASATTELISEDPNIVAMSFDGLFPCVDFVCDFVVQSTGTIPIKVNMAEIIETSTGPDAGALAALWAMGMTIPAEGPRVGAWLEVYEWVETEWVEVLDPCMIQLHEEDRLLVEMHIHLPQDAAYEDLDGLSFEGYIQFIQWNKQGELVEDPFDPFGWWD